MVIRLPVIDANIEQATVVRWMVSEGDAVAVKQPLAEMVTEKASFELESEANGELVYILAPEGSTVPVRYILAAVQEGEENIPARNELEKENREIMARSLQQITGEEIGEFETRKRVWATPGARKLAREHGIDIQEVSDESVSPTIRENDIQSYLKKHGKT